MSVFSIVRDLWPVICLYCIGDILTTVYALEKIPQAQEMNPLLFFGMDYAGYIGLFLAKLAVFGGITLVYYSCESGLFRKAAKAGLMIFGAVLCINNLAVVGGVL